MQALSGQQQFPQAMQQQDLVQQLQLQTQTSAQGLAHGQLNMGGTQQQMPLAQLQAPMTPQMTAQPLQLPQMQTAHMQMPIAAGGEATPTELDRCMAILMPQNAQFPYDKDVMAAQLKATADNQCYED